MLYRNDTYNKQFSQTRETIANLAKLTLLRLNTATISHESRWSNEKSKRENTRAGPENHLENSTNSGHCFTSTHSNLVAVTIGETKKRI